MSTCPLELRTRRDFEALLACVRTIAFLHQRRRQRAPGGEIEAMIDDYGAARALLIGSFFAAEAESLPAAIRELVRAIGDKEEITRTHLRERVSRPRSTFYYQVDKAIELRLLNEKKRGGRCVLTRNRDVPLPEKRPPLPEVEMVEGLFFGVPAPIGDDWFDRFISDFQNFGGPDGITAAEWAAWVGQPIKVVRRRLRRLARWSSLVYFRKTKRYAFRIVETPIDAPHGPAVPANPTPASNSSPGSNSPPDQPKSSDVQPSNESGEDMSAEDASTGSVSDPPLQPPPTPLAPESQGSPDPRSVPEPSATKPPPPAGGS